MSDKHKLILVTRRSRRSLPGIQDFVWAARRQPSDDKSPYTQPWLDSVIRREVTRYQAGLSTHRLTDSCLSSDEDHKWRTCHIDKDAQESLGDPVEVDRTENYVEYLDPVTGDHWEEPIFDGYTDTERDQDADLEFKEFKEESYYDVATYWKEMHT